MTEKSKTNKSKEGLPSDIPIKAADGQYLSALHPKYLHTNSTSHTWPFSAVAELIDNAYDPDVNASQLFIDIKDSKGQKLLILTDNGSGMMPDKLYKMVSFGFSEKVANGDHHPVGQYGNGFKSGSMRLGRDALVFTKTETRWSLGFLSQTYLEKIKSNTIIVPMVTWSPEKFTLMDAESGGRTSLLQIINHSVLTSLAEIKEEFRYIAGTNGTRIIISKLRKRSDGNKCELDFANDSSDIRIPDDSADTDESRYKREQRQDHIPASDYSLRAYCAILYLKPRMQIILRGKKVKTVVVAKSLAKTEVDLYTPSGYSKPVKITFGFTQNRNHYGIMMYHRNRLIKPYVRVGYQLKPNSLGVGVIGVIECDFLQPTHNKQDFDQSKAFRACMAGLGRKLNEYWQEKKGANESNSNNQQQLSGKVEVLLPDQKWVQCDSKNCLKWRILPDNIDLDALPDKWYCKDHPLSDWRSCDIPEKLDDEKEIVTPYKKEVSKQLKREQQQKKKQAEKRASDLQQIVEKKEKELEEEKRRRTQNEAKAKAHEDEIRRLRMQLEKSPDSSNDSKNSPTSVKPKNSCETPRTTKETTMLIRAKPAPVSSSVSSRSTPTTIVLVHNTAGRTTQPTLVNSHSPGQTVAASPVSLGAITVTRATRQSINQAMKLRLPITTKTVTPVVATSQVGATVKAHVSPKTATSLVAKTSALTASTASTVPSPKIPIVPKQQTTGVAAILPKSIINSPQMISLTAKNQISVSPVSSSGPGAPKVYRFVVADPKISDCLTKMKPNAPAVTARPMTLVHAIKSTSSITQSQPKLTSQTTSSKEVMSSHLKRVDPSSNDVNQQLAQIGIDAIAAQAQEDMLPSMAITASVAAKQIGKTPNSQVPLKKQDLNVTLTNGSSTFNASKPSQDFTTGLKRKINSGEKEDDDDNDDSDEIEIIEKKPTKKVKREEIYDVEQSMNKDETHSKPVKTEENDGPLVCELTKEVDKDIREDAQKIPLEKMRETILLRSQQLRDLRKSICQLLGLLVPEINLPRSETMPLDDDTIDVLLRDVLDANKESKSVT